MEMNENEKYILELDKLTGKHLSIYLYQNVDNIKEIHKKLISKELPCCIVKANLVIDPFQIGIAANKATLNEKYDQMVTRSLYTEVIYCLSISKNITQSLSTFGISDDTNNILVVLISTPEDKDFNEKVIYDSIKGERISVSRLSEFTDLNLIKKIYKIDNEELKVSNILDSVISRIGEKISK